MILVVAMIEKKTSTAKSGEGQKGVLSADELAEGERDVLQTAENVNCEHRDTEGTDKKRSGEEDEAILHRNQQHERGGEDRHHDARQPEHPRGDFQELEAQPCERRQNDHDRCGEDFQNQLHRNRPPLRSQHNAEVGFSQGCHRKHETGRPFGRPVM